MKQIFLAQPMIAQIIAMIRGYHNHGIFHLTAGFQIFKQHAHLVVYLFNQPHISAQDIISNILILKGFANRILGKGGIDRVGILQLGQAANRR